MIKGSRGVRGALVFVVCGLLSQSVCCPLCAGSTNLDRVPSGETTAVGPALTVAPTDRPSIWGSLLGKAFPAEWRQHGELASILQAYEQRGWTPVFLTPGVDLSEGAQVFLGKLGRLDQDAIDPRPYRLEELHKGVADFTQARAEIRSLVVTPQVAHSAAAVSCSAKDPSVSTSDAPGGLQPTSRETVATDLVMREQHAKKCMDLMSQASALEVLLADLLVKYAREMNPYCKQDLLRLFAGEVQLPEFLSGLEPRAPQYRILRQALAHYRALATASGTPSGSLGTAKISPGEKGARVTQIQERLRYFGLYSGKATGIYDQATREAVSDFQKRHLLEVDGVAGARTLAWLSVPFAQRVRMIEQNLKLFRESQSRLYERFVRINIPQFMLEYHKNGTIEASHRVIVGQAGGKKVKMQGRWVGVNHTPGLISTIQQIVFNPRWYVSDRIRLELEDEIAADPSYFARHGYVAMSSHYPWGAPRLFQQPGPSNPLGRVKFEFPNVYAVFLHDTPKRYLFNRSRRDFSHGCIRLDRAVEFAQILLRDDQNEAAAKVEDYLKTSTRQVYVRLGQPVPIIVEYFTVTCDSEGQVVFCTDLYELLQSA